MGNCEEEPPEKPVGQLSVNCRPSVDRQVTDSLPTANQKVTDKRPTVGQQSADRRPKFGRQTTDSRPTDGRQVFLGSSSSQLPKILTPAYCPITKASNNSHFHSSHFFALYFPSQYQWFFLSLLPFLILEIKNNCVKSHYTTRTAPRVVRSTKLSPLCGIRTWMGDQKRIPRVVITSFFFTPFRRRC